MVGSRRNLLKLRNNAFRYFAIEEVVKGGSQEKKGWEPRMQDTRTELEAAGLDPLFYVHI